MKIFYTGIDAKSNGIHSVQEFLDIMREFGKRPYVYKNWIFPDDSDRMTLSDWIEFSGAEIL